MADNVGYTPGSGAVIAADDIGGVLHQRVKIGVGADNTAVDVSDVNPMPVSDVVAEETRQDMVMLLVRMLSYLNSPMGYDKSLQRQRGTVVIESGTVTTVSTVTTLSTLTNLTNITGNIGNYQANQQVWGQNQATWAALVRARIT
jgi:hypothetical protein